ncbi:P-loop containing nucleoside triphosphate hydrolase protein [Diplogelasinospora grovesii]|uniref:ATP-dependent RNA helicase n=1 Tax=Diplogelasinospora grovesii TaxID=303347 RepID=A0AAN6N6H9_9PEZI|nr:P-loop containing nucleoside triphosphate hydrolase protein [Diplogelasinospora grovesii]
MYARYIPPPKNTAPSFAAPSTAIAALDQSTVAQPKKIVFEDDEFPIPDPKKRKWDDVEEVTAPSKEKKSQKSKSKEEGQDDTKKSKKKSKAETKKKRPEKRDTDHQAQADIDAEEPPVEGEPEPAAAASSPAPQPDTSGSKPKPKKEKKKKKSKDGSSGPAEHEDSTDGIRKRHKSVLEKLDKVLQSARTADGDVEMADAAKSDEEMAEPVEAHGLEPLPQPDPVALDDAKITYNTLPPWLASPIHVTADTKGSFTDLGIAKESAEILASKGFKEAFAVQTAALAQYSPTVPHFGDVVVAAPTGSGKTLAYVLPMIHDISHNWMTKLRGIIVLPTRDLVQQVQAACEACAAAFAIGEGHQRVKIGTAMGNRPFKEEQSMIMQEDEKYDPEGHRKYKERRFRISLDPDSEDEWPYPVKKDPTWGHVHLQVPKVDVLICTPGRLVEHINHTKGFTLDWVRWLVIDEADKLLAQNYQQWLPTVMEKLSVNKPNHRLFRLDKRMPDGVRKIVVSATMTRDISLFQGLKLWRPRLVLLEGTKAGEHTLPATLQESAIKIRDPALKPLYLIDLLRSQHLAPPQAKEEPAEKGDEDEDDTDSESSDSESDASSSSDDSDSSDDSGVEEERAKLSVKGGKAKFDTTVLIFVKSNEAALRLSRLLAILAPDLAPLIGTLTSSTKTSKRMETLRAFARGKLRILVASDLVSRGIDLDLDHVVNYDIPLSETSYVHRVGRTARAGRAGYAWTLLEHAEARRFWRDFAGEGKGASTAILRSRKVERVRLQADEEDGKASGFSEERVKAYESALEQLRREAAGR